jgi:hypothetical protein
MQIRRRGIESSLDPQWASGFQFLDQLSFDQQLVGSPFYFLQYVLHQIPLLQQVKFAQT